MEKYFDIPAPEEKTVQIVYLNARSLRGGKLQEIETIISVLKEVDIVVITETWLRQPELPFYNLQGFQLYSSTRNDNSSHGGGINVYINESWKATLKLNIVNIHEIMEVEVYLGNQKLSIVAIYNPKICNYTNFISELIPILEQPYQGNRYLIGDFNGNLLGEPDKEAQDLLLSLKSCDLHLVNRNLPTRKTDISETLIDHLYTNSYSCKDTSSHNINYDISDHQLLVLRISSLPVPDIKQQSNNKEPDYNALNSYFENNEYVCDNEDPNVYLEQLVNFIQKATDLNIKTKKSSEKHKKKIKTSHPWTDREYLSWCKRKDALFNQRKLFPENLLIQEEYRRIRNKVTRMKRNKKNDYFTRKLEESKNPRDTWKTINHIITNKSSSVPSEIKLCNERGDIPSIQIPETFNNYFVSIGQKRAEKIPKNDARTATVNPNGSMKELSPTCKEEVLEIIQELKNKKNITKDGITNVLLKKCKEHLAGYIATFVNLSMKSGKVPELLKIARVLPIPKKMNKTDVSNYRPISILPAIS